MGGAAGANWAEMYNQTRDNFPHPRGTMKIGNCDFNDVCPYLEKIEEILSEKDAPSAVIQIGASSVKEIAYLAKKYPRHHFIYIDIFDATIEYAK